MRDSNVVFMKILILKLVSINNFPMLNNSFTKTLKHFLFTLEEKKHSFELI